MPAKKSPAKKPHTKPNPLPIISASKSVPMHDTFAAQQRSVMYQQKVLCNGEATGFQCEHYWAVKRIPPSANPDFLTDGEKLRFCRAWGAEPLEFDDGREGQMVHCTLYKPARPKRKYDPSFEEYKAITDEQLAAQNAAAGVTREPDEGVSAADVLDEEDTDSDRDDYEESTLTGRE